MKRIETKTARLLTDHLKIEIHSRAIIANL